MKSCLRCAAPISGRARKRCEPCVIEHGRESARRWQREYKERHGHWAGEVARKANLAARPPIRCRYCNDEIPRKSGRPRVRCDSRACTLAYQRDHDRAKARRANEVGSKRCRYCSKPIAYKRRTHCNADSCLAAQRERMARVAPPPEPGPCPYCGVLMAPKRGSQRKQCGAPACLRSYNNERCARWSREFTAKEGVSFSGLYRERKSNRACIDCGVPVGHGQTRETRCRRCCGRAWQARKSADAHRRRAERDSRPARARRRADVAASGTAGRAPFAAGRCHSCGDSFVCRVTNDLPRFCSKTCAVREAKGRRRARLKGCTITPGKRYEVYERDRWTCQICGDLVNKAATVPALDAPVVDHRVPLAAGGAHSPENWQTAHYYCNSVKRDQLDFDFATPEAA